MNIIDILGYAVGLSMDAFAVSICKGLSLGKGFKLKHGVKVGLYFGIFQALMPVLGYLLVSIFRQGISAIDHWIAFGLLLFIGGNMLKESFEKECDECMDSALDFKTMIVLAIATSIDAMAGGASFPALSLPELVITVSAIGIATFTFCFVGVKVGNVFGIKYKSKAEMAGGIILIAMAVKFLIEGCFFE